MKISDAKSLSVAIRERRKELKYTQVEVQSDKNYYTSEFAFSALNVKKLSSACF